MCFHRGRRRSRWKLKFHHQALPPEYLDHYEASLASQFGGPRRDTGSDDKARVIGSRAPRNPDRSTANKRPTPPANNNTTNSNNGSNAQQEQQPPPSSGPQPPLPPLAPKPSNGVAGVPPDVIPVAMPFGLEALTRYQALLGQDVMGLAGLDALDATKRALLSSLLEAAAAGTGGNSRREDAATALPQQRVPANTATPATAAKVMTYQDLPYMGEMTLDNMKPRRGRKPKKADICHLIYKNYGTVFPSRDLTDEEAAVGGGVASGGPMGSGRLPPPTARLAPGLGLTGLPAGLPPRLSHSDVQSRIISSLLEKRLTQEEQAAAGPAAAAADEPLNLCVRDSSRGSRPARRSLFENANGSSRHHNHEAVKSEPASPESEVIEVDADPSLVNQEDEDDDEGGEDNEDDDMDGGKQQRSEDGVQAFRPDMLYPVGPGGMYVHPLLYGKGFPLSGLPTGLPTGLPAGLAGLPQMPPLQVLSPLPPLPPLLRLPGLDEDGVAQTAASVTASAMAAPLSRPGNHHRQDASGLGQGRPGQGRQQAASRAGRTGGKGSRPAGSSSAAASPTASSSPAASPAPSPGPAPSPPKRKRSAIFIPPVPPESSNNPTTEVRGTRCASTIRFLKKEPNYANRTRLPSQVSICKFKFTGGAKPSLQEKKMLSVDAGGNFRYYSGTGDKSMRGYEFFPRESMQQQQQLLPKPYPPQTPPPTQQQQQPPPQSESLRTLLFQNVMESLQVPQPGLLGFPPQQVRQASTPWGGGL